MEREAVMGEREMEPGQGDSPEKQGTGVAPRSVTHAVTAKPPTLNSLLVNRIEQLEQEVSAFHADLHSYGQQMQADLAVCLDSKEQVLFWLKVILIAIVLLAVAFGVYDGLLIALFVHLGI